MKQRVAFILALAAFTGLCDADNNGYELIRTNYRDGRVLISYPQIISTGNVRTQTAVNGLLKEEAMRCLNFFDPEKRNRLDLSLSYGVLRKSPGLLCIAYSGLGGTAGSSSRKRLYYTMTLDLKTFKRLTLPDIVEIDGRLAKRLKEAAILNSGDGGGPIPAEAIRAEIRSRDEAGLVNILWEADRTNLIGTERQPEIYSGISNEALVLSVEMPPELGGHAEFALPLGGIGDLLTPQYRALTGN